MYHQVLRLRGRLGGLPRQRRRRLPRQRPSSYSLYIYIYIYMYTHTYTYTWPKTCHHHPVELRETPPGVCVSAANSLHLDVPSLVGSSRGSYSAAPLILRNFAPNEYHSPSSCAGRVYAMIITITATITITMIIVLHIYIYICI